MGSEKSGKQSMPGIKRVVLLVVLQATLISCQMIPSKETSETGWECIAFEPIRWSNDDTQDTIGQILEHNSVWQGLCR